MKLTVHELVLLVLAVRAQGLGVTLEFEPVGPLVLKLTVPCGALLVPLAVSVTVTVQVVGLFGAVDAGQSTVVVVVRVVTATVSLPLLLAWIVPGAGL